MAPSADDKASLLEGIPVRSADSEGRESLLEQLARRAKEKLGTARGFVAALGLTAAMTLRLFFDPKYTLRPVQRPPTEYRVYFFCAGRGSGKSYAGAAAVVAEAMCDPQARILLVGPTFRACVDTMLEGSSGVLTLCPPWFKPHVHWTAKKAVFPNGAEMIWVPASGGPVKFRRLQVSYIWADEVVAWEKEPAEVFKELRTVLRIRTKRMKRLGLSGRIFVSTTPAPTPVFEEILADRDGLVMGRSSTMDNARNLDPAYVRFMRARANTTEGKREVMGELVFNMQLVKVFGRCDWEATRVTPEAAPQLFDAIWVGVDPSTGEKKSADSTGIVVVGIKLMPDGLKHSFILADLSTKPGAPTGDWVKVVCGAVKAWAPYAPPGRTRVLAETNTGGKMVRQVIRLEDRTVRVRCVRAKQSKIERATPVASLGEAGLVHMVGKHDKLEEALTSFTGEAGGHARDDRVDACVWPVFRYGVVQRRNLNDPIEADEDEDELEAAA
jgi:phage terminase large subunit-like protein